MEQINNIELTNPDIYPNDEILQEILEDSFSFYKKLLSLYEKYGLIHEWRYYKDGKAWLCKVQKKKRTIVWMSAWKGYIKATVYLPSKYEDGIYNLDIDENEKDRLKAAKNVGKSKPCMFDIKSGKSIETIEKVIDYKINL